MSPSPSIRLNSGFEIPSIGLGTWLSKPEEVEKAVEVALKTGYRHIDTAAIYQNEKAVGRGIKASGVSRGEIFLTSKLWNNSHRPENVETALQQTLAELDTSYLDLYLIHWPVAFKPGPDLLPRNPSTGEYELDLEADITATWRQMEKMVEIGKVRSIDARIVPAVNQIEAHPALQQNLLTDFLRERHIVIEAYSPLGNNVHGKPRILNNALVEELSKELGVSPARLLISWAVKRNTVVLPKSVTPERIVENLKVIDLDDKVMSKLNEMDRHYRYNTAEEWGVDVFGELGRTTGNIA